MRLVRVDVPEQTARALVALGEPQRAAQVWRHVGRKGRAKRLLAWQNHLAKSGVYSGPFDGVYAPAVESGLIACAKRPGCRDD